MGFEGTNLVGQTVGKKDINRFDMHFYCIRSVCARNKQRLLHYLGTVIAVLTVGPMMNFAMMKITPPNATMMEEPVADRTIHGGTNTVG